MWEKVNELAFVDWEADTLSASRKFDINKSHLSLNVFIWARVTRKLLASSCRAGSTTINTWRHLGSHARSNKRLIMGETSVSTQKVSFRLTTRDYVRRLRLIRIYFWSDAPHSCVGVAVLQVEVKIFTIHKLDSLSCHRSHKQAHVTRDLSAKTFFLKPCRHAMFECCQINGKKVLTKKKLFGRSSTKWQRRTESLMLLKDSWIENRVNKSWFPCLSVSSNSSLRYVDDPTTYQWLKEAPI